MARDDFVIIAHRGFSSKAPENTIAAFDLAVTNGFTNLELDVRLSSDGIPVIIHDPTLDRTTNGSGRVTDFNVKALQELDAGSWFNADFTGQCIITLRDLLSRYAHKTHLHIELKSDEQELPAKVVEIFAELNLLEHKHDNLFEVPGITITSFNLAHLERSLSLMPTHFTHSWLVEVIDKHILETAIRVGIEQLCPQAQHVSRKSIALALTNGLTVRGQGVKNDEDVRRLYDAGALGTTTNWPDRAQEILATLK